MDDVTAVKMNFRKEQWKQLILERQASGLSINNWCKQHGFKRTTIFTGFVVFGRKPAKHYRIHKLLNGKEVKSKITLFTSETTGLLIAKPQ